MGNVLLRKVILLLVEAVLRFPIVTCSCPPETDLLRRVGNTRFYIVHANERGNFVTFQEAFDKCKEFGLEMAKVKNMMTMVVVGRELEKVVERNLLKDTWYWLDAKFNPNKDIYEWGQDGSGGVVQYSNFLYRYPRPTGVAGFVNYMGEYRPNHDVEQCITLALPWPGKADPNAGGAVFGHHTIFDERPCESQQKRHAICESVDVDCKADVHDPFTLSEDKGKYFENGTWIFGDRRYLVNWKHRTINESDAYCKSLGLELFQPEVSESGIIPYLKMWSREVTVSQFWTAYSFNSIDKSFLDPGNEKIVGTGSEWHKKFQEDAEVQGRSSKLDSDYCVALVLSYEFKGQLPCEDQSSPNCTWSFVDYVPTNCNNYLATICQHEDMIMRDIMWHANYVEDVDTALKETALTNEFGSPSRVDVLRSKYKQTFGILHCPKGYRMLRARNEHLILRNDTEEIDYPYDYTETYWVVDEGLFDKNKDSVCTISEPDDDTGTERRLKTVKCTEWHFYCCEKINATHMKKYSGVTVPTPPKMIWKEGPQPRIYPLLKQTLMARSSVQLFGADHEPLKSKSDDRFILKTINTTKNAFSLWKFKF